MGSREALVPYVICSDCRVTTYSAALWSGADECPSCGRPLPVRRRITGAPVVPAAAAAASAPPPATVTRLIPASRAEPPPATPA